MVTIFNVNKKITRNTLTKKTALNIVYRGMKNSLEPVLKEGKNIAEKVISTQASNIQSTASNQNQSSINAPSSQNPVPQNTPNKEKTPFDEYKGPLQPQESIADSVNSLSPEAQRFQTYVDNKLIEYSSTGETKLTSLGYQLFMATQPKIEVNELNNTPDNNAESSLKGEDVLFQKTEEKPPLIAGMLKTSNDAEILTPIQTHLVVGVEQEDNSVRVFSGLTSEKGTKSGIQSIKTTYKIADSQPISGHQNKGQYARPISPQINVPYDQFEPHQQATDFVNEPEVHEKFKPIPYKDDGITRDDLDMGLELKQNMSELTAASTEEQESDDIL